MGGLPRVNGGNEGLGKNVDTRNPHKGYVLGPGSIVEGKEYVALNDLPIAKIPARLFEAIIRETVEIKTEAPDPDR